MPSHFHMRDSTMNGVYAWYTARSPLFDVHYDQIHYVIVSMHYPFVRSFAGSLGRSFVRSFNTLVEFGGLSFRSSGSHTFPHVLHFISRSSDSMQNYSTETNRESSANDKIN